MQRKESNRKLARLKKILINNMKLKRNSTMRVEVSISQRMESKSGIKIY